MSGAIPGGGMLDVLREIEARRVTGRLQFTTEGRTGHVQLVAGQIALEQEPMADGTDPVEVLLKARKGDYTVHQRLPSLPVSQGDDEHRTGSLEVHVPADLMNYCEQSGVTGTLRFAHDGNLAELVYDAGELLAIRLDGQDDADLSGVFSWDGGTFDIQVGKDVEALVPKSGKTKPPPEPEDPSEREPTTQFVRPRENTGQHFLKVFEVALTDVVSTRERVRPKARTSPPRAPSPSVRPPPAAMPKIAPPTRRQREHTVRIAYLAGDDESALAAIDHVTRQARSGSSPDAMHVETRHDPPSTEQKLDPEPPRKKTAEPAKKAEKAPEAAPEKTAEEAAEEPEKVVGASDAGEKKAPAERGAAPGRAETAPADGLGPVGWTVAAIAAGVAAYYLLSHLLSAS